MSHYNRFFRSIIVGVLTFLLIFFWMIPVAFASGLANMSNLSKLLPFLQPILGISGTIRSFVEGFLPGLVLIIFFAILVKLIIIPLARAEGQHDMSVVDRAVFNKYFLFLVFNIFLGSIFASGVFSVLTEIISRPDRIPSLLAYALPRQVTYFISYVMILSLSGFALSLLQPKAILKYVIGMAFAKTERDRYRALDRSGFIHYAPEYSYHCLVFVLVSVYSTVNPLIVPFGCIYFGLAYITERHNILYYYPITPPLEARYFPSVFTRLVWAILIFQISVAAILGLSEFPAAAAIFVLFVATFLFWIWSDKQLHPSFKFGVMSEKMQHVVPSPDTYQYPSTRPPLFQLENPIEPVWWPETFVERDQVHVVEVDDSRPAYAVPAVVYPAPNQPEVEDIYSGNNQV